MKITKRQLKRIIREETQRLAEIGTYDETQAGQVMGSEVEDKRFNLQVQLERDVKTAMIKAITAGLDPATAMQSAVRATTEYEGL